MNLLCFIHHFVGSGPRVVTSL